MKRAVMALAVAAASAPAVAAGLTGFVQARQVQRAQSQPVCGDITGCSSMAQEVLGELLYERRFGQQFSATARVEAFHDGAISEGAVNVREGFVDWSPTSAVNLKLGRQVLTWGVSDYLYVNDVFPKNYDAFFTGAGFDRMKEPVDAARVAIQASDAALEAVLSRSKADKTPDPDRFSAMSMARTATRDDSRDHHVDVALKASTHVGGWDLAAYGASFDSREERLFMDAADLRADRPRTQHLGLSLTGNFAGGLIWGEGAVRNTSGNQAAVVSRQFLPSAFKLIGGYSREVGQEVTASAQLQLEGPGSRSRYLDSLAPGVRPLKSVTSTLHLRVQGRWINQTFGAGAQLFVSSEGDSHLNPFVSWSPADGWALEGGANVFNGKPDTRYGAFKDDSNVYVLWRFSF